MTPEEIAQMEEALTSFWGEFNSNVTFNREVEKVMEQGAVIELLEDLIKWNEHWANESAKAFEKYKTDTELRCYYNGQKGAFERSANNLRAELGRVKAGIKNG